jgi:acetyl-CoA carboxylase biotin carboxylase subunit
VQVFERECSIQRRGQKLIEEAPSPNISPAVRERLCASAVALAREVGYMNAGTVEFLVDVDTDAYYFIEVNARIQVEHGVTEMVTGIDLVAEQLRVAGGLPLSFRQEDLRCEGTALEFRINPEDPAKDFLPSPGRRAKYAEYGMRGAAAVELRLRERRASVLAAAQERLLSGAAVILFRRAGWRDRQAR